MNGPLPSPFKIIPRDYLAFTLAGVPAPLWLLFIVVYGLPAALNGQPVDINGYLILLLLAVTGYCWLALAWRVTKIRSVFSSGIRVQGTVTKVWFFRQRGQVSFNYSYLGTSHQAKITLVKNKFTSAIQPGDKLTLLVDPDQPSRTFLQELFI